MAINPVQASPKTGFLNSVQQKPLNLFKAVSEKSKADSFALSEGREEKDGMFKVGGLAALLLGSATYLLSSHKMLKAPDAIKLGTKITAGTGIALMLAGAVMPLINRFEAKKNAPKVNEEPAQPQQPAQDSVATSAPVAEEAVTAPVVQEATAPAIEAAAANISPAAAANLAAVDAKIDNIAAKV